MSRYHVVGGAVRLQKKLRIGEMTKKFYKSVVTITIVDEAPLEWNSMDDIAAVANEAIVAISEATSEEITAVQAAAFAIANDSDPEWFGIDADGVEL